MATKKPEMPPEGKIVRLAWGSADDLPALYANHLFVTHGGETEFHVIFGHLTPPLMIPESQDEIPDEFVIKPVAKIVVTPATLRKFLDAMESNLKKFEERKKKEVKDAT